jgi:GT2 family glycosyltransferase
VVVSNDSRDPKFAAAVQAKCGRFDFVRYVEGPRRGLCANRNHVIRNADTSHVSLIDDDGVVGRDFVDRATRLIDRYPDRIITGDVLEDGVRRTPPTNPTFLGHFGKAVRPGERLENINLNCNVLPRRAFNVALFDESIAYGYEDMDLCAQLLTAGFEIVHIPELVNQHLPPAVDPAVLAFRASQAERARLKVLWRRWFRHDRRPLIGSIVYSAAVAHLLAHRWIRGARV